MVAKVIIGTNINGALNYNELKVREGKAECIAINGFIKEANELTFKDKLTRFEDLTAKNRRSKTNTLHISLNFDPSERLTKNHLSDVANLYLQKIGFGKQPYLVYQHFDAAHPHVHIVTISIQEDGKRIALHNIGRNQSEKARKEIEEHFNLVKAESKRSKREELYPLNVQKIVYGKSETKRSISNIVRVTTSTYKYTSLPELNAILNQYNVIADRGTEGTKMFENKGLVYSLLNERREKVGVPIKSSSIYGKPTLAFLERQFKLNEVLRRPYAPPLKASIDNVFVKHESISRQSFSDSLHKKGISVVFRDNKEGVTYGITFVDHNNKVVFNGSDLGKGYGAKSILERLSVNPILTSKSGFDNVKSEKAFANQVHENSVEFKEKSKASSIQIFKELTNPQPDYTSPNELLKRRRRKKKKGYRL
jgi:hypothetical protein